MRTNIKLCWIVAVCLTGKCFYRGGLLVPASLDLYMAMEYMNQVRGFRL